MSSLASHQVGKGKFEGLDLEEKFDLLADINDTVLERVVWSAASAVFCTTCYYI